MSRTKKDRPGGQTEAIHNSTDGEVETIVTEGSDLAAQLNRRREAAKRMPPLRSGRRDPWGGDAA